MKKTGIWLPKAVNKSITLLGIAVTPKINTRFGSLFLSIFTLSSVNLSIKRFSTVALSNKDAETSLPSSVLDFRLPFKEHQSLICQMLETSNSKISFFTKPF